MKRFKRFSALALSAAVALTIMPMNAMAADTPAGTDATVRLNPASASTFHDTNGDGLGEFEGWGTSLCWWANRLGYDEVLTQKSADAFFGPNGLWMSIGRYNIGGGDMVGTVPTVPVNDKAMFYDLSSNAPTYEGTSMRVSSSTSFNSATFTVSDADFGYTKGQRVGSIQTIGYINGLGAEVGSGGNLHYTVTADEEAEYTVKLVCVLAGTNSDRGMSIKVNGENVYGVDTATLNQNIIASTSSNRMYMATMTGVALKEGENTIDVGGYGDNWGLDFVKMAVVKSGEEGILPETPDFIHPEHIIRSDSAVPGYCVDVTKIDTTKHDADYYTQNFTRADFECGYAWNYDWDADKNQMNILLAAAKASGDDFIAEAFSNSPPYFMTVSGCSSGHTTATSDNLRANSYTAFANYMADVMEHWTDAGVIEFQSVTGMNEPDTNYWSANSNKQEGCHFSPGASQSKVITELDRAMKEKNLDAIISGTDETSIDTQINSYNKLTTEAKNAIERIDAHRYGGSQLTQLRTLAENEGKNLWMSEVDGSWTAGSSAGEMAAALGFANEVVSDLNGLKPAAWILWNAVDMHVDSSELGQKYVNLKSANDFLTETAMYNSWKQTSGYWGLAAANHDTHELLFSKKYYAYGQFSRYIRPGDTIISSSTNTTAAAYDSKEHQAIIVAVNTSGSDKSWTFDLSAFNKMGSTAKAIRTSGNLASGENWADVSDSVDFVADTANKTFTATMKANSITTFIVEDVEYDPGLAVVKVDMPETLLTNVGQVPELPATVQIEQRNGNKSTAAVTWDAIAPSSVAAPYATVTVNGVITEHKYPVSIQVCVVPANLRYFIDAGRADAEVAASTQYDVIAANMELQNKVADKAYEAGSWGYVGGLNDTYGIYNDGPDMYTTGQYALSGKDLVYKVPLKAGAYVLTAGYYEWWSSRNMTIKVTAGDTTLASVNVASGSKNKRSTDLAFALAEDTEITLTVTKQTSNAGDPVFSWFAVVEKDPNELKELAAPLPAIAAVVGTTPELPKKVQVKTYGDSVVEADVVWDNMPALTTAYKTVTVTGIVKDTGIAVSQDIEVIPENVLYFIDCNTVSTGSAAYDAVAKLVNLKNEVSDKDYAEGSWGVANVYSRVAPTSSAKTSGGYLGRSGTSAANGFTYRIKLDAGVYNVAMDSEYVNSTRSTTMVALYTDKSGATVSQTIASATQVSSSSRSALVNKTIVIPEDNTEVTLRVTGGSSTRSPYVTFIGVNAINATGLKVTAPEKVAYEWGEQLDTTGLAVAVQYADGTAITVDPADCEIAGFDGTTAGKQTVTVTYKNMTGSFEVEVAEQVIPKFTGLEKVDGEWVYLTDDVFDESFTGLAKNYAGWWYVKNGKVDFKYTGLGKNEAGWWYVKDGKVDLTYTGMAKNDYGWWYVKDGKVDLTFTGMAKNEYGWWYLKDGKFDNTYTGIAQNDYGWWYIENGGFNNKYTGTVEADGTTYQVTNGKVAK